MWPGIETAAMARKMTDGDGLAAGLDIGGSDGSLGIARDDSEHYRMGR